MSNRNPWPGILILMSVLGASSAWGQKVEITPFFGYQLAGEFEDRFEGEDVGSVDVEDGEVYGLLLDFGITRQSWVEFMYSHQETGLESNRLFGPELLDFELEYYHVGYLYQWTPGQVRPYVVASLGATRIDAAGGASESRFSFSLGAGVKLMVAKNFGFRFEGRLYSTVIDEGDDLVCDRFDCDGYDDGTYLTQFDAKAGIVFAF